MKRFKSSFFGGYQREEVDEYVEALLSELEHAKTEAALTNIQESNELKAQLEREQKEKASLQNRLAELESRVKDENSQKEMEIQGLREKLNKYESSYDTFANVISAAKKDADKMVEEAKEKADQIKVNAQEEAALYRDKIEKELQAKREDDRKRYAQAKYRLKEYLDSLNHSQRQLIKTYNELGEIVKRMPVRIEDVFSEKPMELLPEMDQDGTVKCEEE